MGSLILNKDLLRDCLVLSPRWGGYNKECFESGDCNRQCGLNQKPVEDQLQILSLAWTPSEAPYLIINA